MPVLLALFYLVSCKEKVENEPAPPGSELDTANHFSVLEAYPGMDCIWQDGTLNGVPIRYGLINNEAIFEGDIILTPEQLAATKNPGGRTNGAGTSEKILRWRDFTIPYTIDSDVSSQSRIKNAIAAWEAKTPIRFVVRTDQTDYVTFRSGSGCSSNVGRLGTGQQFITISALCSTRDIVHEIGHTIGLFHEQNRSDRDDYITVHFDNIKANKRDNFIKYNDNGQLGFDRGQFDFKSIMLYPSINSFAIDNKKPTMTRKKDGLNFEENDKISNGDHRTVTTMYANLYIMKSGGHLHAVCVKNGQSAYIRSISSSSDRSKTMAEDNQYIWYISQGTLHRIDRLSGDSKSFDGDWNNVTGITSILNNNTLWAIKGNDLFAINKQGQRTRVTDRNWNSAQAILAHKDYILVARSDNKLARLDLNTKEVIVLNNGNWFDVRGMAVTSPSSTDLYIVQGDALWRVNIYSGAFTPVSHGWSGTEAMAGLNGSLFIVQGGTLWKVDTNGNRQSLGGSWSGTQSIGVIRNPGLL
jgi:hypothetical protein